MIQFTILFKQVETFKYFEERVLAKNEKAAVKKIESIYGKIDNYKIL